MLVNDVYKIENKILAAMEDFEMLDVNDTVIVGVSGGADSMALLHFLNNRVNINISVIAAHINHNLRGEESLRDENFVRSYCAENEIKLEVLSADIKATALEKNIGIEECARKIRYNFFKELCIKASAKIATAHTLSDAAETLIFNLTRGSGLKGLCSIPIKYENLIRPLRYVSREEIEQYCNFYEISYVNDSTNSDVEFSRNRIRHNIIPELKKLNPSFESSVLRLINNISNDDGYLNKIAKQKFDQLLQNGKFDIKALKGLEKPILSRVIKLFVSSDYNLESKHFDLIYDILEKGNGAVNLPGNKRLIIKNGKLVYETTLNTSIDTSNNFKKYFKVTNSLTLGNKTFIIKIVDIKEFNKLSTEDPRLFKNSLDYATINNDTIFRNRREKDKFKKAGSKVTKTLKKLFNEYKIDPLIRSSLLILDTNGNINWIEGFGPSDYAKVSTKTEFVALILPEGDKNA